MQGRFSAHGKTIGERAVDSVIFSFLAAAALDIVAASRRVAVMGGGLTQRSPEQKKRPRSNQDIANVNSE